MFKPLGINWQIAIAILASFLAREVFVSTLGTIYGISSATDNIGGLVESLQTIITPASGWALLVFYAIAMQCISTLVVLRRETGSRILPWLLFVVYTLVAYVLALIVFNCYN